MILVQYTAHKKETNNLCRNLVRKPEGKRRLDTLKLYGNIKWNSKKVGNYVWYGFRIDASGLLL
jgi:hypothetical protein